MGSSIDISQPDIYNLRIPKKSNTRHNSVEKASERSDKSGIKSERPFGNKP
jgi:hypothetical protein